MNRRDFIGLAAASATARNVSKVETGFKSPGPQPNGLQAAKEGLWIIDQGDNHVYLVSYENGKAIRGLPTGADKASGITYDGEALWLASTYNRLILGVSAGTGKTLSECCAPGAGVIYRM